MRLDRRTDGKTWRVCRSPFRQEMALKCHKSLRVINMIFSSSFFFFFFPWDIILGLQQYVDISYAGKCLKIPRKCWYLCWVLIYTNVYRWFFLFPYYVVCIKVDCKCDMLTGELSGSSGSYEHLLINIMRFVFFSSQEQMIQKQIHRSVNKLRHVAIHFQGLYLSGIILQLIVYGYCYLIMLNWIKAIYTYTWSLG